MPETLLSSDARQVAGILLLTIVTVQAGGLYLLKIVLPSGEMTPFQKAFARAGHAHAGILVTLALVIQILADAADMSGFFGWLGRFGVPIAAILMSAGFFLSSARRGATRPNALIVLVYAGAVMLAAGVVSLGIGLIVA